MNNDIRVVMGYMITGHGRTATVAYDDLEATVDDLINTGEMTDCVSGEAVKINPRIVNLIREEMTS